MHRLARLLFIEVSRIFKEILVDVNAVKGVPQSLPDYYLGVPKLRLKINSNAYLHKGKHRRGEGNDCSGKFK